MVRGALMDGIALLGLLAIFAAEAAAADVCSSPGALDRALVRLEDARLNAYVTRGLRPEPPKHVRLDEVLARQKTGTALLFYAAVDERTCAFLVKKNGSPVAAEIGFSPARLEAGLKRLGRAIGFGRESTLRAPRLRGEPITEAPVSPPESRSKIIDELSAMLMPDKIGKVLGDVEQLLIVPIQNIGTVPFSMLRTSDDERPLIERMATVIVPSFAGLTRSAASRASAPPFQEGFRAAIVGNPDFSKEREWHLPALKGAEKEASTVARLLGATALTGTAASKSAVLRAARSASILYFATHGVVDRRDPLDRSFLALSDGGRWTAREIQSEDFSRVRLVVLSACQTALGQSHDVGIIGLARAFILARVPHVVMSLWNVDDDKTAKLMIRFMESEAAKDPVSALREAMLETRRLDADPIVWAAFTIFGSP